MLATERDQKLIKLLGDYELFSTRQILKTTFPQIEKRTALRRLRKQEKEKSSLRQVVLRYLLLPNGWKMPRNTTSKIASLRPLKDWPSKLRSFFPGFPSACWRTDFIPGFNTQKNLGLSLGHKFSRVSYQATKNYYQAMQIAHLFLQVFQLSKLFKPLVKGKITITELWEQSTVSFSHCQLKAKTFARFQVRYD